MHYKQKGRYVTFVKIRKTRDIYHCPYEVLQVSMTLTGSLENKQIDGVFFKSIHFFRLRSTYTFISKATENEGFSYETNSSCLSK